jgi:lipopolysaccharide/colanic/teichoic acid biosynthesis glycosyltransferase
VSLWLDIKIMVRTIKKLFTREGIDQEGYVSAEEFMGLEG